MRLYITGNSGFIGQHLNYCLKAEGMSKPSLEIIPHNGRVDVDINSPDAFTLIVKKFSPTHVLHLAWSDTSQLNYDEGSGHEKFATSTLQLSTRLASHGIVNWIVGTGLENDPPNDISAYGRGKLNLKSEVLNLANQEIRWISMPYIFSIFHHRPRIVSACIENEKLRFEDSEHDYLEIRDAGHQISKIVVNSDEHLNSVTSGRKISNLSFCHSIRKAVSTQPVSDCVCQGESNYDPHQPDNFYTSLILD